MSTNDFSCSLVVNIPPETIYLALNENLHLWWTEKIEWGHDQFTVYFGGTHKRFSTQSVLYNGGDFHLVWHCVDANLLHPDVENPQEWIGSQILWSVTEKNRSSTINLTHKGLNNTLQCYDICVGGWNFFFQDSLKNYLETGIGKSFSNET